MTNLLILLSECTSQRSVDRLVEDNVNSLPNPFNQRFFCHCANNAKRRIVRIKRETKKSYHIYELN